MNISTVSVLCVSGELVILFLLSGFSVSEVALYVEVKAEVHFSGDKAL